MKLQRLQNSTIFFLNKVYFFKSILIGYVERNKYLYLKNFLNKMRNPKEYFTNHVDNYDYCVP